MPEPPEVTQKAIELMKDGYICDSCLGRNFAELLSGMTNEERGKIIRRYIALLVDSGQDTQVDSSNFDGIEFRNVKMTKSSKGKCKVCENFFLEENFAYWRA